MTGQVFAGVRVIELAQYVFVTSGAVLLADQGAEVIHVEPPGVGDPYRTLKIGDGRETGGINLAMEQNNRNKKSLAVDLKTEEGREALLKLVETADVFMTSLRPKAIRALRLTLEDLRARNPKIIYARGNGYGFKGPEADRPGFDSSSYWARGGVCYAFTRPGEQPPSARPAFGDHAGGVALAFGVAGALYKRAMTGEPSLIETSLLSTAAWQISSDLTYAQMPGYKAHGSFAVRQALKYSYTTRDGKVFQLMLLDPRPHWGPLCRILGLEALIDDPRFVDEACRVTNSDQLIPLIQEKIGAKDWAEWEPDFQRFDGAWELIRSIEDVRADPQVHANEMMFRMAVGGTSIDMISGPTAFDGTAKPRDARPSPRLGEHSAELLAEVGYTPAELDDLRARAIVQ